MGSGAVLLRFLEAVDFEADVEGCNQPAIERDFCVKT
jgi:hypothetical protein